MRACELVGHTLTRVTLPVICTVGSVDELHAPLGENLIHPFLHFSPSTWTLLQYKREGKGEKWRKRRKRRRIQGSLTLMNLHLALPNPSPHFQVHVHVHVCSQKNCVHLYCGGMSETSKRTGSCGLHASSLIHRPE